MANVILQWQNVLDASDTGEMLVMLPANIGRAPGNDLVLYDKARSVSRRHVHLLYEDGMPVIVDRESTNGVYIAGQRVYRTIIADGMTFALGAFMVTLRMQIQCSNVACGKHVATGLTTCPWCGYFLADAHTRDALLVDEVLS